MTLYDAGSFDVAVIGAGHAGIEAALACARLNLNTILFTINLDAVGNMPCNPSIGGTAKGHLVREIDALGGEMGKAADETFIQSRMLNLGKGPAVHSLRAQIDRRAYQIRMKQVIEQTENLILRQGEIVDIEVEQGKIKSVITRTGGRYYVKAAIICSGTYLEGKVIIGESVVESGPDGMQPAKGLSQALAREGIELRRFKTGTPCRILKRSIDFSQMEVQPGDDPITPFSFDSKLERGNSVVCHLVYTNEKTHEVIRNNFHRSPLFSGVIEGVGPRYCPSIEDKVRRFADKSRHQLFVEPMGLTTEEMYLQGFSSSLPEEVQLEMLHTIKGMEHAVVMRTAYAIEYDCVNPFELKSTFEFKKIQGLYGAGQFNGSSGYEEAAAQGLYAGINAALKIKGKEPMILDRSTSYLGTLVDDLVTKGTNEPYRMMTSRSEYRLLLRQDNADARLTPTGYKIGLISEERYQRFLHKQQLIEEEIERVNALSLSPIALNPLLNEIGSTPLATGIKMGELIKRPEITYAMLKDVDTDRPELPLDVTEQVEISLKYDGYIKRQLMQVDAFKKLESKRLPEDTDYAAIEGLRIEARQKLNKIKPENLGQASRISGVSPADISVLIIWLQRKD